MVKYLIILLFIVTACHEKKSGNRQQNTTSGTVEHIQPELKKGVVVSNSIFSYYLPAYYSDTAKLPIIFIFDPHGKGNYPLNKYAVWAEQYGFILAASNVSKNGLPQNQLKEIIHQLFTNVSATISYASSRVYVMGFSGGARVASIAAMEQSGIRGMILCGGGLAYRGLPQSHTDILAYAGEKDFNLTELLSLDSLLAANNFRHHLLLFNGTHQWPDSTDMADAFMWTLFNEMKDKVIPVNDTLINRFISSNEKKINLEKNPFRKYLLLKKVVVFTDGLVSVEKYRKMLNTVSKSAGYKKYIMRFNQTLATEQQQEQQLLKAMSGKPFEWWKNKISELSKDTAAETIAGNSHRRILNYLSLAAYMQSDRSLKNHQDNLAGYFIGLYQLIDPKNTEGYYMEAQLAIRKNNFSAAIISLQKAIDLGFDDFDRISTDPEFMPVYGNSDFEKLLQKIKK